MKLMRVTTNYPAYLAQFFAQYPNLGHLTYKLQHQTLMSDCYGWADHWQHALDKLGYEVWEPVGNAESIQKTWAKEHNIHYGTKSWLLDIMAAQIKVFAPEILFVNDYTTYTAEFFQYVRAECSSIRLIIGWCGAPFTDESVFKAYDIVLSNIPELVAFFRERGCRCEHFNHAFAPRIINELDFHSTRTIDFSFIGSIVKSDGYHNKREKLLKELIRKTNLEIWSDVPQTSYTQKSILHAKEILFDSIQYGNSIPAVSQFIQTIPKLRNYANARHRPKEFNILDPAIIKRAHKPVFGLSMYQTLADSKISLNTHIDISKNTASNMRLFEATGVGTCLLTDWQENLHLLFEPDAEVVTYRSIEEAIEKTCYLLEHEKVRSCIAKAGQCRTLRDHSFELRANKLDSIIRDFLQE